MRRFRFHLGTLLILVLLFGVGFAALRESSAAWDSSLFSITVGILLTSILLAVHRTARRRAFWLGFALFGLVYLALTLIPPVESRLITTRSLAYLASKKASWSTPSGVVTFDYDNDGLMDLYVVNNVQPSVLYRNTGNGAFVDLTAAAGSSSTLSLTNMLPSPAHGRLKRHIRKLREDRPLAPGPDRGMPGRAALSLPLRQESRASRSAAMRDHSRPGARSRIP